MPVDGVVPIATEKTVIRDKRFRHGVRDARQSYFPFKRNYSLLGSVKSNSAVYACDGNARCGSPEGHNSKDNVKIAVE